MNNNKLLEYKGYHAKIELDIRDKIFVGTVIGINDSLNFHGHTIDELQQQFENSIDNYLEMCEYFNKKPEKEYKGTFNIRIPSDMHRKLDVMAAESGSTINQLINYALQDYVESAPKKEVVYFVPITKTLRLNAEDIFSQYKKPNENTVQKIVEKCMVTEVLQ